MPAHVSSMDWKVALAIGLLGFTLNGFFSYFANDKTAASRLTAVEAHQGDTEKRLDRMESKLDTIFYYVTGIHAPKGE